MNRSPLKRLIEEVVSEKLGKSVIYEGSEISGDVISVKIIVDGKSMRIPAKIGKHSLYSNEGVNSLSDHLVNEIREKLQ